MFKLFLLPSKLASFSDLCSWQDVGIRTHDDHRREGYTPSLRVVYAMLMVLYTWCMGLDPTHDLVSTIKGWGKV